MFLKQIPNKKSGKTFLSIVKSYKHKESGNVRTKTILSIGYLEDIRDVEDPIAHYTELARQMTLEANELERTATIQYKPAARMEIGTATHRIPGLEPPVSRVGYPQVLVRPSANGQERVSA